MLPTYLLINTLNTYIDRFTVYYDKNNIIVEISCVHRRTIDLWRKIVMKVTKACKTNSIRMQSEGFCIIITDLYLHTICAVHRTVQLRLTSTAPLPACKPVIHPSIHTQSMPIDQAKMLVETCYSTCDPPPPQPQWELIN